MKHFLVVVAYSQTDQSTILVKNCVDIDEAKKRVKIVHPNAVQIWIDGEVSDILE